LITFMRAEPLAKLEFLDLTRGGPLDRTEDELAREFEFGEPLPAEFKHLVRCDPAVMPFL
jgi:hypothetical protein